MDSRELLWGLFANSTEMILLVTFFSMAFERRKTIAARPVATVIYVMLYEALMISVFQYKPYRTVVALALKFLLVWITFQIGAKRRVLYYLLHEFILLACDVIALIVVVFTFQYSPLLYASNEPAELAGTIIAKALASFVIILVARNRQLRSAEAPFRYWVFMSIVPVASIIIMSMGFRLWLVGRWDAPIATAIMVISFAAINFLIMALWIEKWDHFIRLKEMESREIAQEKQQVRVVAYYNLRKMFHDIRKHMVYVLSELLQNNPEKAESYLLERDQELLAYMPRSITGNHIIDAMLSDAESKCLEKGVKITYKGALPELLEFSDNDMVLLVGNAMENAAKATPAGGVISVSFSYRNNLLRFTVTNPKPARSKYAKGSGLGIPIIQTVVDRYAGWVDVKMTATAYKLSIYIQERSSKQSS